MMNFWQKDFYPVIGYEHKKWTILFQEVKK